MSAPKQTVLVGIALGSNTASVSFLLPGKNNQPTPVSGWPDAEDVKSLLVPIRIKSYLPLSDEPTAANIDWGYSVKEEDETLQETILRRAGDVLGSASDIKIVKELRKREGARKYGAGEGAVEHPFRALEMMSSFVEAIKFHIEKRVGLAFGNEILQNVEYDVCVTVPPWWGFSQRDTYAQYLRQAYGKPRLLCEATASLVYYLSKNKRHQLQAKDTYISCNVEDEITTATVYAIVERDPKLQLDPQECAVLTIGSINFSNNFQYFIESRLSTYLNSADINPEAVLREFDKLKSNFVKFLPRMDGSRDYKFRLPWNVPDSVGSNIVDSQMTVSSLELKSVIFDPILSQLTNNIIRLKTERKQGNTHILLSGILSECPYASKCIERNLTEQSPNGNLKFLKTVNGGTSHSRGAALYLDTAQNKSSLVAPPPFTKEPQVISVTDSRLVYLKLIEEALENNMSASIESRITHCRRILTERISCSGYEADTLWAFSFLGKLYGQARKLAERDALRREFEKLFISDAKKKLLDTTGLDAVHLAALTGSTSVLEFLVKSGCPIDHAASPEASEYDNWTALHFAVSMGEIAAIKWLLEKGADTSAITARFQTPLHIAISELYQPKPPKVNDLVELLLPSLLQKPALNFEDDSGMTALDLAKSRSLGNTVLLLTQYGATENPRIEKSKLEAVHAAKTGNAALLQKILRQTPSLNRHITPNQESLLHFAAESGSSQAVIHLLNTGVDVNQRNLRDETPLHVAATKGHDAIVKLLAQKKANLALQNSTGNDVLHIATEVGNVSMVNTLLQLGAKPGNSNSRGWTPLHIASEKDSEALIKLFLARGANVNGQSIKPLIPGDAPNGGIQRARESDISGGWTPLHIVAYNGNEPLVKMLIKSGADVHARDLLGYTPLHRAVQNGRDKILVVLMKNKADPKTFTLAKQTTIHDAARSGHEIILKTLLKETPKTYYTQDEVGRSALHEAVEAKREEIVKMLLRKGFPPNPKTIGDGYTPLSMGVLSGVSGIVKLLLKSGADPNIVHNDKGTLLHLAARSADPQAVMMAFLPKSNVMPRDENNATPLHTAVAAGNMVAANILIRHGFDLNAADKQGRTPFFVSVEKGNIVISTLLADSGASLETRDNKRSTPLHTAASRSNTQYIQFLCSRKVGMDPFDSSGRTPLHYAIENNDQAACQLLLDFGARADAFNPPRLPPIFSAVERNDQLILGMLLSRVNCGIDVQQTTGTLEGFHGHTKYTIGQEGWTPLHVAAWYGHAGVTSVLIQHGANVNAKAKGSGMTPLHLTTYAFQRKESHLLIARTLLDYGADLQAISDGKTILQMSALTGNQFLIPVLIERGISLSQKDTNGRTALHHAAREGHYDTCVLLLDSGLDLKAVNEEKGTYLHIAASANRVEIVKLLVSRGLGVNQMMSDGSTPLHLASVGGYGTIITELLKNGADSTLRTVERLNALDLAAIHGHNIAISTLLDAEDQSKTEGSVQWQSLNHAAIKGNIAAAKLLYERVGGMKNRGSTVLHWAVQEGLLRLVELLVEFGADVNVTDDEGWSPLQKAAMSDQEAIVSFLLEKGVDIEHHGPKGQTALHQAVSNNSTNTVKLLVAKGADATVVDENGSSPFHLAIGCGHTAILEALPVTASDLKVSTTDGKSPIQIAIAEDNMDILRLLLKKEAAQGDGHETELHTAVRADNADLVKLLIEHGAAVNSLGDPRDAPLSIAVNKGFAAVAKVLLEAGADVNKKSHTGYTPIEAAAWLKNISIMKLLIAHGADVNIGRDDNRNALIHAADQGDTEVVRCLIEAGADLTAKLTSSFWTAIHYAGARGHDEIITLLLDAGVDINIQTRVGGGPIHTATRSGQVSSAKLLVSRGANIHSLSKSQETPLFEAARNDSSQMVDYLLKNGAAINIENSSKQTPLHLAAYNGQETVLRILVEKGGSMSPIDQNDYTCFHFAASAGYVKIGKYLLSQKQSMEARGNRTHSAGNLTPLHIATTEGHEDFVRFLLDEGADLNAVNQEGANALHLAASNNRLAVARLLVQKGLGIESLTNAKATPLQLAVTAKHVDLAEFLLDQGADVNAVNGTSSAPLLIATQYGPFKLVELLVRKGADKKIKGGGGEFGVLHIASSVGQLDTLKFFIDEGLNLEEPAGDGSTPLLTATACGNEPGIRMLLDRGANLSATSPALNGGTPFIQSARTGTPAIMKLFASLGADLKVKNTIGWTALHYATIPAKEDMIDLIVDLEPSLLEEGDTLGWTPLHRAVCEKQPVSIKKLIARGAVVDAKATDGRTPLSVAARIDYVEGVEIMVQAGASMTSVCNFGWTPIHYAASENRLEAMKKLISLGCDPHLPMNTGHTPLHIGAQEGHPEVLSLLLEHKVNIDTKTERGYSPLHLAAEYDRPECITFLVQRGADDNLRATENKSTALHIACQKGKKDVVRRLIEIGAEVNPTREMGYTPLLDAVWYQQKEVSLYLIREVPSININTKTEKGHTPLHLAAEHNDLDVGRELILNGAEVESHTTSIGYTPLHITAETGSDLMARLLISNGASLNSRTLDKRTPLHVAAQFKQSNVAQILIMQRADLNAKSEANFGGTPLHLCAEYGALDVAVALCDARPDFNARDKFQFTPLMRAIVSGKLEMVELLVWKSDLALKGQLGWTALHWCAYQDNPQFARILINAGASKWIKSDQGLTARDVAIRMEKKNALPAL